MNSINNIVLDIDGVLACHETNNLEEISFFKKKGAIISAIKTHYIFPGVIEFIKLLHQTKNVRVSFFSSGDKNRNKIFVKELLELALPENEYEDIKKNVCILSRNDLEETSYEQCIERKTALYSLNDPCKYKYKDISKALIEKNSLQNAVLIDDDQTYVAPGQEKNFLYAPCTETISSRKMINKAEIYEIDGKPPSILLNIGEPREVEFPNVKKGKKIIVIQEDDHYDICFQDKKTQKIERKTIPLKDNEILISSLKNAMECLTQENKSVKISEDKELQKMLCTLVDFLGGTTRKIHLKTNRIFYTTGLLFKALEDSQTENISLSEALSKLQFKKRKNSDKFHMNFKKIRAREEIYLLGLRKLKKINNNLELTTPHNYIECINLLKTTEEELIELQKFKEMEDKGCCIF